MVNFINFNEQWVDYIVMDQFKISVTNPMFDISLPSSKKIFDNNNFMPFSNEVINQVGTNKSSSSSYLLL
jgi:hypothetical protein